MQSSCSTQLQLLEIAKRSLVISRFVPSNADTFPHEVTRRGAYMTREVVMARRYAGVGFFRRTGSVGDAPGVIWAARLGLQHSHYVRGELFGFK